MADRTGRIPALILSIVMLFAVLFSVFYIAHESGHHCGGDDCRICVCLEQCSSILQQAGYGALFLSSVPALFLLSVSAVVFTVFTTVRSTPVSCKVRLNN